MVYPVSLNTIARTIAFISLKGRSRNRERKDRKKKRNRKKGKGRDEVEGYQVHGDHLGEKHSRTTMLLYTNL